MLEPVIRTDRAYPDRIAPSVTSSTGQMSAQQAAKLLLDRLEAIESIIQAVARRYGFSADLAEDFGSWVKLRLVERRYRILRQFAGGSRVETYLTVVIRNMARDYLVERNGRFRPSRCAQRRGVVAVELERLVYLEGRDHEEAIEIVRRNLGAHQRPEELAELIAQLPARPRTRVVDGRALERLASDQNVDERVRDRDLERLEQRVGRCLGKALASMSGTDRDILRLRFEQGWTAARVARRLDMKPRHVYSRCYSLLRSLRHCFDVEGLTWPEISQLIGTDRARASATSRDFDHHITLSGDA